MNYRFLEMFWRVKVKMRLLEVFTLFVTGFTLSIIFQILFIKMGGPGRSIVLWAGDEWWLEFALFALMNIALYPWLAYKILTSLDDNHED